MQEREDDPVMHDVSGNNRHGTYGLRAWSYSGSPVPTSSFGAYGSSNFTTTGLGTRIDVPIDSADEWLDYPSNFTVEIGIMGHRGWPGGSGTAIRDTPADADAADGRWSIEHVGDYPTHISATITTAPGVTATLDYEAGAQDTLSYVSHVVALRVDSDNLEASLWVNGERADVHTLSAPVPSLTRTSRGLTIGEMPGYFAHAAIFYTALSDQALVRHAQNAGVYE